MNHGLPCVKKKTAQRNRSVERGKLTDKGNSKDIQGRNVVTRRTSDRGPGQAPGSSSFLDSGFRRNDGLPAFAFCLLSRGPERLPVQLTIELRLGHLSRMA
jgi:hypothetical protein